MKISLKPQHLKRYKDIALLFLKYGQSDLVQTSGLRAALTDDEMRPDNNGEGLPEQFANDLEKMGPTYIKMGQLLSGRADLLPDAYLRALTRLQDKVKPFPAEEAEQIITSELGVRMSKAFSHFDKEPLAAASLGQVHKAALRDGRPVVVKVQRPNIRKQIADDLEVIEEIASFLEHTKSGRRYQVLKVFEEFQKTLISELDYHREAANLNTLANNLQEFELIKVPRPVMDYTTRGVLTMEYIDGTKITSLGPLARMELNGNALADQLFKAYLKQILVDGVFHADPHPGNVFVTEDGRIGLIDLGMIGRTSPAMQQHLIKLLIAISEGRGEAASTIAIQMSETTHYFNEPEFRRKISELVTENQNQQLGHIDVGKVVLEVTRTAGLNGLFVPIELSLLGKTLLQLDEIGKTLDPDFNPNDAVRRHVTEILNKQWRKNVTSGSIYSNVLEMKEFIGQLPTRLNRILDTVANAELEVKVRATDVGVLMEGFQKVANRITTGLILAALIIGASLLMQVETTFRIFGYPGLGMLCFLAAGGGGFWLVISIFLHDHKTKRKNRRP